MKYELGLTETGPDPFGEYLGSESRSPVRVRWENIIPAAPASGFVQTQEFAISNHEASARLSTTLFTTNYIITFINSTVHPTVIPSIASTNKSTWFIRPSL